MPLYIDFEYLCATADKAGWLVELTLGAKRPRGANCHDLGYIRLKRNATAAAKIAVPVGKDLGAAARIALDQLLTRVKA